MRAVETNQASESLRYSKMKDRINLRKLEKSECSAFLPSLSNREKTKKSFWKAVICILFGSKTNISITNTKMFTLKNWQYSKY